MLNKIILRLGVLINLFLIYFIKCFFKNSKEIKVYYGKVGSSFDKDIYGGKVKILLLRKFYPESLNPSIFYFASSAIPPFLKLHLFIANFFEIPIILNQNGVAYPAWEENYKNKNKNNLKLYNASDYVIFQSKFCKQSVKKWLSKAQKQHSVLYNPIKIKKKIALVKKKKITLIVAGTHNFSYRITKVIDVLDNLIKSKHFNSRLIIAGKCTWKNSNIELNQLINKKKLKKKIFFYGEYNSSDLKKIFKYQNSILIHLQYNDASPTVPLEAQSYGIPVIYQNNGGTAEIMCDDKILTLNNNFSWHKIFIPSTKNLYKKILKIINDFKKYSNRAYINSKKYDHLKWIEENRKIFYKILNEKRT